VQIQHQLRGQRLHPQLPDALHRQIVVEDHPLGAVPERFRGGRRLQIIALAPSRVVAAPSICEEVIASSISELNRKRSRLERLVTPWGATALIPACLSIVCSPWSSTGGCEN